MIRLNDISNISDQSILKKVNKINQLDFVPLKNHLLNKGYIESYLSASEGEYKKFLILLVLYPDVRIAPNRDMDFMWHHHILNTRQYIEDMNSIFGHYLHHEPSYTSRNEDVETLPIATGNMTTNYKKTFGQNPVLSFAGCSNVGSDEGSCWPSSNDGRS